MAVSALPFDQYVSPLFLRLSHPKPDFPTTDGTIATTTANDPARVVASSAEATPTFIPTAVFQTVTVVAADSIPSHTQK
jgi:hypothetical protein